MKKTYNKSTAEIENMARVWLREHREPGGQYKRDPEKVIMCMRAVVGNITVDTVRDTVAIVILNNNLHTVVINRCGFIKTCTNGKSKAKEAVKNRAFFGGVVEATMNAKGKLIYAKRKEVKV